MHPELRYARADEVSALQELERAADTRFAEVGHPELADGDTIPTDVAERAIANQRIVVAVVQHAVAGWIYTSAIDGELCIGQVCVHPQFGGRGIGSALLRHIIDGAGDATSIVLNTQRDVPWNQPWYEKHGFVVVPEEEWTDSMRQIAQQQTAAGLDWTRRCHMRLALGRADKGPHSSGH